MEIGSYQIFKFVERLLEKNKGTSDLKGRLGRARYFVEVEKGLFLKVNGIFLKRQFNDEIYDVLIKAL